MTKWKPEVGEGYFVPGTMGGYSSWKHYVWDDIPRHELRYEAGIVCRSAEDALKLAQKMLAVAKECVEND